MDRDEIELRERQPKKFASVNNPLESHAPGDSDARALARQGKRQQLKRNFGLISGIAFSSILLTSWEAIAVTIAAGLTNGGPVSLIYGFFLSFFGSMALCLSLAEMASIAPVSSAQYHFVAILAPARASRFLSWIAGWITVFAWQANISSVAYLTASLIQSLIVLNNNSYVFERWHGTLLFWAIVLFSIAVNTFGNRILPHIETLMGILHICLWFAFLIPLVYLSPQNPASFVFTGFENSSGWANDGVSWCIGLLTITYPFIGFEGAIHISEETENAQIVTPRSMIISLFFNGLLGFGFLVGFLFSTGNIKDALSKFPTDPLIWILYQATQSKACVSALFGLLIVLACCAVMGMVASTSRLTWAFARDNGLPFSTFFAHVDPSYRIPIRAIFLNATVAMLINLINIASSTAFSAILSLTTISLYISYLLPTFLLVLRRFQGQKLEFGPWTLGRFGLPINIFGLAYGIFVCIFVVFPTEMPVTAENMNYASLMFGSVIIFILVAWLVYGRRAYHGPIRELPEGDYMLS